MSDGLLLSNHGNLPWFYSWMLAGFRDRNLRPMCWCETIRRELLWPSTAQCPGEGLDTAQGQQPAQSTMNRAAAADCTNSDFQGLERHLELAVTWKSIKTLSTHPCPRPRTWNCTGQEMGWEMLHELCCGSRARTPLCSQSFLPIQVQINCPSLF